MFSVLGGIITKGGSNLVLADLPGVRISILDIDRMFGLRREPCYTNAERDLNFLRTRMP